MKHRVLPLFLLAALMLLTLSGCSLWGLEERLEAAEDALEARAEAVEEAAEAAARTDAAAPSAPAKEAPAGQTPDRPVQELTREEAEAVALAHAELTAAEVKHLQTEYDIDDGVPEYEVQFRHGVWEYEYEIHAETGAIRSWDRDD